ncbi:MAG: protein translocase subunit SecD, partial [Alphaproteobacteria bacterium]|nr:protein translocase subunit SecD [Alphaproteobacteria bacterium]
MVKIGLATRLATWLMCLFLALWALPTVLPAELLAKWPKFLPRSTINLGLDLRGGSQILLEIDYAAVNRTRLNDLQGLVRRSLRDKQIGYVDLVTAGQAVTFKLLNPDQLEAARAALKPLQETVEVALDSKGAGSLSYRQDNERQEKLHVMEQSIEIVRRRIDETGTKEPSIQRQGDNRILVQLPGVDSPEHIKNLLGKTAKLTFHLVESVGNAAMPKQGVIPADTMTVPGEEVEKGLPLEYMLHRQPLVDGSDLVDARATFQEGQPVVSFKFNPQGARLFGQATKEHTQRLMAIVLDNKVISAPRINEPILAGSGIISGNFTPQSAKDLSLLLRSGALPAPLNVIEERTVGPSLGADSISKGKLSGFIALALVAAFMMVFYRFFGLLANLALVINLVLVIGLLAMLQATLTLPGIAGIILTIGMAVDANILIYERIKEEVRRGRTPIAAIDAGFSGATRTIIDSNLTTMIAAVFLFVMGSGPIRGFAVTLLFGIVTTVFCAVMVTRLLVLAWYHRAKP